MPKKALSSPNFMTSEREVYKNRDMILGEIHESTKNTEKNLAGVNKWCSEHDKKDDKRFFWGAITIMIVAFYAGVLPQLFKILHLG